MCEKLIKYLRVCWIFKLFENEFRNYKIALIFAHEYQTLEAVKTHLTDLKTLNFKVLIYNLSYFQLLDQIIECHLWIANGWYWPSTILLVDTLPADYIVNGDLLQTWVLIVIYLIFLINIFHFLESQIELVLQDLVYLMHVISLLIYYFDYHFCEQPVLHPPDLCL